VEFTGRPSILKDPDARIICVLLALILGFIVGSFLDFSH
jgi:hypothetical protein